MGLLTDKDEMFCKAFPATLSGKTMSWFAALKARSISSWSRLQGMFLNAFATAGTLPKDKSDLSNIKQRKGESTLQYLQRFKQTLDDIQGLSEEVIMTCFEGGILPSTVLKTEFGARPPTSIGEILQMALRIGNSEVAAQPDNHRMDGGQRPQHNKSASSNKERTPSQITNQDHRETRSSRR